MSKIVQIHTPGELKNIAINGAFDFFQEKQANVTTVNTSSTIPGSYSADMFKYSSQGTNVKNYSLQQSSDVPTFQQAGFTAPASLLFTQITGLPTFNTGDYIEGMQYVMEGKEYSKIHGRNATFGFWIKGSIAGTYSFALRNDAGNRSYVTTFTINQVNTWEFKSITIKMDTGGTWKFDNSLAMYVDIGSMAGVGSTWMTSSLNGWQSTNNFVASTSTNYMGTSGATLRMTMFSIVEGSLGFGSTGFQRHGKDIAQELIACQRHYLSTDSQSGMTGFTGPSINSTNVYITGRLPVTMRSSPSVSGTNSIYSLNDGTSNYTSSATTPSAVVSHPNSFILQIGGFTALPSPRFFQTTITGSGYLTFDARL